MKFYLHPITLYVVPPKKHDVDIEAVLNYLSLMGHTGKEVTPELHYCMEPIIW
jgi:hypothetical protein